ncbi:MAG: DNA-processing protein DprA [Gemmatimonadota bacterium]
MTTAMMTGTSTGERPTRDTTDPLERAAWLQLATTPGLGSRRLANLLQRFGTAVEVLDAPRIALTHVDQISARLARLLQRGSRDEAESMLERAREAGQQVLVPPDSDYPSALRSIPDPPPILFAAGHLELLSMPAVAIIGSRSHTRYGADLAARLAEQAVRVGVVVVSGMARGLDAVAQAAALDAGGFTIGVLGAGVDVIYPARNRELYRRVRDAGLLISEHPPGALPSQGSFPRRNRIISGLSRALVVVEAAVGSGTLITVECALEQGRDVLAVPGPITSPTSVGTNRLVRDGATPILSVEDLPALLGLAPGVPEPLTPPCTLSPEEARVFDFLTIETQHVDELALRVGFPIGTLLGVLLGLELGGLAEQLPGALFRRSVR